MFEVICIGSGQIFCLSKISSYQLTNRVSLAEILLGAGVLYFMATN